jgi:uncharacterized cupredoxin-like copper-binding protein
MRSVPFIFAMSVVALTPSGCSAPGSAPTASPPAVASPAPSEGTGAVAVQLIEWKVVPDPATVPAGRVSFSIKNVGMAVHELVVVDTDLKAAALPVSGEQVDESGLTVIGEVEDIPLRATPRLDVDLAAGHYVLMCNIEGHYAAGMRTDFDVA